MRRVSQRHRWHVAFPVAAIAIAVVLFALNAGGLRSKLFHPSAARAIQPEIRSLAALPLTNLSGDPAQEYLADGVTDELISELSHVEGLNVISRTSVIQYKGEKKKSLSQIGGELNADAVLEGTVLRSGDRVRIEAHMIYAPTDQLLLTETFEQNLADVFKLQSEVAQGIAKRVRLKINAQRQARLQPNRKVKPEAMEDFLKATEIDWNVDDPNRRIEARRLLIDAIQKDPTFARAYSELALLEFNAGELRRVPPREAFPEAKQLLRKALELDEKDCDAHRLLSEVLWRYEWDWQAAEKECSRTLEICPNNQRIHWYYAIFLSWSGRPDDAMKELTKSRELSQGFARSFNGGALVKYLSRDFAGLAEGCREFVISRPND